MNKDNFKQKKNRFLQRLSNFELAYKQLEQAVAQKKYTTLERSGLIKTFEYTFELAWKCLKDYLESEGASPHSPRKVIQESFKTKLISDAHDWIHALENRNILAHAYSEELAQQSVDEIKNKYFKFLTDFREKSKTL